MSTPDVTHLVSLPTGAKHGKIEGTLRLIVADTLIDGFGWTVGGTAIAGRVTVKADSTGLLTFPDVNPNEGTGTDVVDSPDGSVWELVVVVGGYQQSPLYASFTDVAGPVKFIDYVTDPPDTLTTSRAASTITIDDDDLPWAISTVQDLAVAVTPAMVGAIPQGRDPNLDAGGWYDTLAAAQAGTGDARVLEIGDSIWALNVGKSVGFRLEQGLATHNGRRDNNTCGWRPAYNVGGLGRGADSCQGTPVNTGLGGYSMQMSVGHVGSWTFTGDGYDVHWTRAVGAGSIQVRLDGNLVDTISTAGAAATNQVTSYTCSAGTHTVTLTITVATTTVEGMYLCDGNTTYGVRCYNASHAGYGLSDFTSNTGLALDAIAALSIDLVIVALGTNNEGTFTTDFPAFLTALSTKIAANKTIVFTSYASDALAISDAVAQQTLAHSTCRADGRGYVSVWQALGDLSTIGDGTALTYDYIHLGVAGEQMYADLAIAALAGDLTSTTLTQWRPGVRGPRVLDGLPYYLTKSSSGGRILTVDGSLAAGTGGLQLGLAPGQADTKVAVGFIDAVDANRIFGVSAAGVAWGPGGTTDPTSALLYTATGPKLVGTAMTFDANSHRMVNLTDPSGAQDADTKAARDAAITAAIASYLTTALDWKASCRVATTANITLSGAQTIDGVSVIAGDRVLVKNQSTGANNGIYVCASGAWSRATDADTSAEVTSGMSLAIEEGTVSAGKVYLLTTANPITLGTTALTFTQLDAGDIKAGVGAIVNADVNAAAAIAYSKLNLAASIVNADIATLADLALVKLGGLNINAVAGTTLTLAASDCNGLVASVNVAGATFTVPNDASVTWGVGKWCYAVCTAGPMVITNQAPAGVAGSGTFAQGQMVLLIKTGANTWYCQPFHPPSVTGDVTMTPAGVTTLGAVVGSTKMAGWTVNAQTGTTYTFVAADAYKIVTLNNAGAITATIDTFANQAIPTGSEIIVTGIGAGLVTIAAAGGVTINNPTGASLVLAQYQVARLVKIATNTWEVNKGSRPPDGASLDVNASGQLERMALTGDVTASAGGAATTIAAAAVTNAKMANMTARTYKGRHTNSTGAPEDVSTANLAADLDRVIGGATRNFGLLPAHAAAAVSANRSHYTRIAAAASTPITAITLLVSTASGNVDVGSYPNSSSGVSQTPGTKYATAGSTACPASGSVSVTVSSSAVVLGDWFGMACDNGTANFRTSGVLATVSQGLMWFKASDFPLPSSPSSLSAGVGGPIMVAT